MLHTISAVLISLLTIMIPISVAPGPAPQKDNFNQAIKGLSDGDPKIRHDSVNQLWKLLDHCAVESLVNVLSDSDASVRDATVEALGWIRDVRATEPLIALLSDKDPAVCYHAAQALGRIGDVRAVEALIDTLEGNNFSLKCAAAESLGNIKDVRAFEPLIVLLWRGEGDLHVAAERALIEMGPLVVEQLCALLKDGNSPIRFYAVRLLTRIHDPRAIEPLLDALEIRDNGIGEIAAEALIGMDASAVARLIDILESRAHESRRLAAKALGQIRDDRAVEPLLAALKDESTDVRRQSFEALVSIMGGGVIDIAAESLNDPGLRDLAALALGQAKDERAIPHLIEVLRSDHLDVLYKASRALVMIGRPSVDELIAVLLDQNPAYPEREIKQRVVMNTYSPRCGNEPPPPILDPRRLAALALGDIGDERAIEPLRAAMKDKSETLQFDAASALKKLLASASPLPKS